MHDKNVCEIIATSACLHINSHPPTKS